MSATGSETRFAVLFFTDIVGSTELKARHGVPAYRSALRIHNDHFERIARECHGIHILRNMGDGYFAEAGSVTEAVRFALLFQDAMRVGPWGEIRLTTRVGIHAGEVTALATEGGSGIVAPAADLAERVMKLAVGGQILLTRFPFDEAQHFLREHPAVAGRDTPALRWLGHGAYLLMDCDDPIEIFEVGAKGFAPFTPPAGTEKLRRSVVVPPRAGSNRSPAVGAALAVLCGLLLWHTHLGVAWERASYDYLFLFPRTATNNVVLVLMDEPSYRVLNQKRGQPWDRANHVHLLKKLTADVCRMVVLDVFLEHPGDAKTDEALADAMRQQGKVILAARLLEEKNRGASGHNPGLQELFRGAALDWGYATTGVKELETPRWLPFDPQDKLPSLPRKAAAHVTEGRLPEMTEEPWLRYYREDGGWKHYGYHQASSQPPEFFHDKIVFIGSDPARKNNPEFQEEDKFCTPFTRWTDDAVGGVEIMATTFLNLVNGDWLRRPAWWMEALGLVVIGISLGGGLCLVRSWMACLIAVVACLAVTLGAISLSHYTNFWFPWLVIAAGQVPCALAWALFLAGVRRGVPAQAPEPAAKVPEPVVTVPEPPTAVLAPLAPVATSTPPEAPDYQRFDPPFGEGGFGKVWLVRNATNEWQALKAVYQSKFGKETGPYDTEFRGIQKYKPVSKKHPGLLGVDFVSLQKPEGYFYYVMELGDSQVPDWEEDPATYKPWNLEFLRTASPGGRVPLADCVRIGLALADALAFLHHEGLIHRDIKPSNVIFVKGQPKFADVGLMTNIRPLSQIHTWAGTHGYMPPNPNEPPGTVPADIYALGMVLYVISTGHEPAPCPVLATTLMQTATQADYLRLNAIILKACQPDPAQRFTSAAEMRDALLEAERSFISQPTGGEGTIPA